MARQFLTDIELGAQRELRFGDADSSAYVGFKSPATVTTDLVWTLPAGDGSNGQVLSTNGSAVLSWATASGGSVTIGTSAADVLSAAAGEITADDAAADKIVFWDDSASKLTYLTVGSNLTITDTTIAATGGGGGTTYTYSSSAPVSPSAGDEWLDSTSGILYTYVNDGNSSAWVELGPFGAESISPTIAGMIF